MFLRLRIRAPGAFELAPLKKNRSPDSRAVVDTISLYAVYHSLFFLHGNLLFSKYAGSGLEYSRPPESMLLYLHLKLHLRPIYDIILHFFV